MVGCLRTGQLAGVDDEAIARDYALTRVGREPAREMVMARLAKVPFFQANAEGALNMLSSRFVSPPVLISLVTHRPRLIDTRLWSPSSACWTNVMMAPRNT